MRTSPRFYFWQMGRRLIALPILNDALRFLMATMMMSSQRPEADGKFIKMPATH